MPFGITAHVRLLEAVDVGHVLAHVGRAGDQPLGPVGHPALDAVDVGLRVLVDPALVAPVLGGVDRDHERRAEALGQVVAGARPRASRGRARRRSRSGRRAPRPRPACPRSCARSRPRTRRGHADAPARARDGSSTPPPPPRAGPPRGRAPARAPRRPARARFSASLRTWRARPPSISGGYSQDRMRTRIGASRGGERGEVEVGREVAERGLGAERGVCQSGQRGVEARRLASHALAGVVGGQPRVAMKAQSLDWSASSSRAARSSAAPRRASRAAAATVRSSASRAREGELGHRRRVPGREVLVAAPARGRERALRPGSPARGPRRRSPARARAAAPPRAPRRATPAPRTTSARAARCRARSTAARRRSSTRGGRARRSRARARARGPAPPAVVGAAAVVPRLEVVEGAAVVVAVGAVSRVAARVVPHQLHRRPVDRHRHRARLVPPARAGRSPRPVWSTQKARTPWSASSRSSPGA